jgi:Spy/CpxP family protein refolding chaperone
MAKKILIGLGALAIVIAAGAAWAHGRHGMGAQAIKQRVAKMEDLVNASKQQRQDIDGAVDRIVSKLQGQRQSGTNMHQQLMNLLTGDQLNKDQINTVASQYANQMTALVSSIADDLVTIHDTLSSDQRQQLATHLEQMRQKRQNHAPQGGFGGPGE